MANFLIKWVRKKCQNRQIYAAVKLQPSLAPDCTLRFSKIH